jgi:3-methylfumaryl-CoA hydratase
MNLDIAHLKEWIGRTESRSDIATAVPLQALAATLDRDDPPPRDGDPVPPCWHWLYFLPLHRQSEIGPDGHARRGGFLPPVPLPRRMWAGSRLELMRPVAVGDAITRISRIVDVSGKEGRTGPLLFVLVRHEVSDAKGVALTEDHDIVYRESPRADDPAPPTRRAPDDHQWIREIRPDDVLLFRYSALTFNGHRIHYDRRYVTEVEGYPGLVVHGPLIATLLLDLLRRQMPDAAVARFSFRAVKPLFDVAPFFVCGRPDDDGSTIDLWAKDRDGALAMEAAATLA